jgi:squalene synthase HpnC
MSLSRNILESYRYCKQLAHAHYENFPIASFFIPKDKRRHFYAAYAFLRTADDIADNEALSVEQRWSLLMDRQKRLDACYEGRAEEPIFIALGETVRHLRIPKEIFYNLLNAFKTDLFKIRYQNFNEVLEYCAFSANPVGRLTLYILGYSDHPQVDRIMSCSDAICTGLQLVNHWQDVFIDQKKDRLYLPQSDLKEFNYTMDDWHQPVVNESFRKLMAFEVERAVSFFKNGKALFQFLKRPEKTEIKLVWHGGMRIVDKLKKVQYDVLNNRPEINNFDKAVILKRAFQKM